MSSLGPTWKKTHDPEQVTSPFWVSVFLPVKWGWSQQAAVGGRAYCFLRFSLVHCPQTVSAHPH